MVNMAHSTKITALYERLSCADELQGPSNSTLNQQAYYTDKIMTNPQWTMAGIFADDSAILGPSQKVLIKEAFI